MNVAALAYLPDHGAPELLYLLFHGVGATAAHMAPLAQRLALEYPQAAVLCLNRPQASDGGLSQGAIMALEAVQAEARLARRVLAFAGRHATAPTHAPADTSVHLLHGLDDPVIAWRAAVDSAQRLVALGATRPPTCCPASATNCTWH